MRLTHGNQKTGFSLVEFVVATLIILSTILVLMEVQVKTSMARESVQGGQTAHYNGTAALDYISLVAKQSGFGLSVPSLYGVTLNYYDPPTSSAKTETWAPVVIGGTAASATLRFMWSDSEQATPTTLASTYTPSSDTSALVDSSYGLKTGELLLFSGPSTAFVKQITSVTSGSVSLNTTGSAPFNGSLPAISGVTLPIGSQVFKLGGWERQTFYLQNGSLWVRRQTATVDTSSLVADNVIGLSAQYGLDDGSSGGAIGDGVIDAWVDAVTTTQWPQVSAVRVGLLTRSPKKDKNVVTTSNAFDWSGGTFTLANTSNWNLYRYRVFEYTLPLRNTLWPIKTS